MHLEYELYPDVTQRRGTDAPVIQALANGTVAGLTIGGSNTFEYQIQKGTTNLLINGTVRQDGRPGRGVLPRLRHDPARGRLTGARRGVRW